jgi:hypothetical protein
VRNERNAASSKARAPTLRSTSGIDDEEPIDAFR